MGIKHRSKSGTLNAKRISADKEILIAGTVLNSTELGALDGVTAGTVTASKAVVVDSNKDIGDFRNLDAVNIDAGASGTAGSVDIFPATASKGKLTLACTNQTGNTTVTLNANAMGQATTVNITDPGGATSYVMQSAAAVVGVTATAAEINKLDGAPFDATITVGAENTNAINVTIQLKDANGTELATRASVFAYLSDDANGDSIAGTAPSSGWAIGTDGLLIPVVTNKAAQLVSEADGDIDITITEASADTWYLILVLPNGLLKASGAITFAGD